MSPFDTSQESMAKLREALARGRGKRILVIGDLMLDEYVWGSVERVSQEAPVQILEWRSEHDGLGGAANVAHNLTTLGCEVWLAGVLGADEKGARLRGLLEETGIHTDDVMVEEGRPTTTKLRIMAQAQQILRIDREQTRPLDGDLGGRIAEAIANRVPQVDAVICSDYAKGVLTPGVLGAAREAAAGAGKLILADPKGTDFGRYQGFDYISPNLKELEAASRLAVGTEPLIVRAGEVLLEQTKGRGLLVTRGRDGMTLLRADQPPKHIPATAREVYDVAGAGDTVISVFGMALAGGADPAIAAELANHAAGVGVSKVGATAVTREELTRALDSAADSTRRKIVPRSELDQIVSRSRAQGKNIVFTNGCFDLLHVGHIKLLQQARSLGDMLIVGVNDDASVRALKGATRPVIGEMDRALLLAALDCVDCVTVFPEETPQNLIELIRPDVLAKGDDWAGREVVGRECVESYGGRVELLPVVEGSSTSELIQRIAQKHRDE